MKATAEVQSDLRAIGALGLAAKLAAEYHVPMAKVIGRDRHKTAAAARHHLWALIHGTLVMSYPEVAEIFGVDHTTVMAAIRKRERSHMQQGPSVVVVTENKVGGGTKAVA